jgi:hypothetical protein
MQTVSYRGIALSGLMPTPPAIVFRLAALCVSGRLIPACFDPQWPNSNPGLSQVHFVRYELRMSYRIALRRNPDPDFFGEVIARLRSLSFVAVLLFFPQASFVGFESKLPSFLECRDSRGSSRHLLGGCEGCLGCAQILSFGRDFLNFMLQRMTAGFHSATTVT